MLSVYFAHSPIKFYANPIPNFFFSPQRHLSRIGGTRKQTSTQSGHGIAVGLYGPFSHLSILHPGYH